MKSNSPNLTWHNSKITREDRETLLGQRGFVIWLTGLSSSGKSTIANILEECLIKKGYLCYVLDGDNIRHGLNTDLGFSAEDRRENIRRIGEVASLFADAGIITVTAFISPYKADRNSARRIVGDDRFIEVYLDVPLSVCEKRDPKNLYQKARTGEIHNFTGISAPYEAPDKPEIILHTAESSSAACVNEIINYLLSKGFIEGKDE
ncbi:MAG: adenylyl-sulfate kinase [Candidatus Latescibacteria bacterium]|jgi:adenylylsulfate kinase|nr:adenylyl-sulfate kinase [Candidatus Latescibacterota bacterium]